MGIRTARGNPQAPEIETYEAQIHWLMMADPGFWWASSERGSQGSWDRYGFRQFPRGVWHISTGLGALTSTHRLQHSR